jgi:hypothetical protein
VRWTGALTLFAFEAIAGIRAGLSGLALIGSAVIGACLGATLFTVKVTSVLTAGRRRRTVAAAARAC